MALQTSGCLPGLESCLQESTINLVQGTKEKKKKKQSGAELSAQTEELLGCIHKHELKSEIIEGMDGSRVSKHSLEQRTRQPRI